MTHAVSRPQMRHHTDSGQARPSSMPDEHVLNNATIITRSEIFRGSIRIRDGRIADMGTAVATVPSATDLQGDYLLPGLIEMHTDNLEKHLMPRPGVEWPSALSALMAHDVQTAGAGITTVFDSVFVGEYITGGGRKKLLDRSIAAISTGRELGILRADHMLHLRCELADAQMMPLFRSYADISFLRLVSMMDHTPGQRQWSNIDKWRQYHKDKKWTDEEARGVLLRRQELQRTYARTNQAEIVAHCREHAIPLASHDDTTVEHVLESLDSGVVISEFPTTVEAARKAREVGLTVTMGAPNVVRGGSHSGNVSALELAREGLLDALSSDYAPKSLLHGAFLLHQKAGLSLPDAVATVSANLANVLDLSDRGRIETGLRADLIHVSVHDSIPLVRTVWRQGRRVI